MFAAGLPLPTFHHWSPRCCLWRREPGGPGCTSGPGLWRRHRGRTCGSIAARPRQRLPHGLVSSRRLGTRHPPCNVLGPATIRLWRTVQQVAATDLEGGAGAAWRDAAEPAKRSVYWCGSGTRLKTSTLSLVESTAPRPSFAVAKSCLVGGCHYMPPSRSFSIYS